MSRRKQSKDLTRKAARRGGAVSSINKALKTAGIPYRLTSCGNRANSIVWVGKLVPTEGDPPLVHPYIIGMDIMDFTVLEIFDQLRSKLSGGGEPQEWSTPYIPKEITNEISNQD